MTAPKDSPRSGGAYITTNEIYALVLAVRDDVRDIQARQATFRRVWAWLGSTAGIVSVGLSVAAFVSGQGG